MSFLAAIVAGFRIYWRGLGTFALPLRCRAAILSCPAAEFWVGAGMVTLAGEDILKSDVYREKGGCFP